MTPLLSIHTDNNNKIKTVNKELAEASNWFKANELSVNASKTNYMVLGTSHMTSIKTHKDLNIVLDDTVLERVKCTKFLDVLTDECLTWKNHIDCISKTISRNTGVMNKLELFIPGRILTLKEGGPESAPLDIFCYISDFMTFFFKPCA